MSGHPSNNVTLDNVKDVVRYHRPSADQSRRHEALSLATEHFIETILHACPDCADRTAAIRKVREAKMTASAAIALEEGHEPADLPKDGAPLAVGANTATGQSVTVSDPPPVPQPPPPAEVPVEPGMDMPPSFKVERP